VLGIWAGKYANGNSEKIDCKDTFIFMGFQVSTSLICAHS